MTEKVRPASYIFERLVVSVVIVGLIVLSWQHTVTLKSLTEAQILNAGSLAKVQAAEASARELERIIRTIPLRGALLEGDTAFPQKKVPLNRSKTTLLFSLSTSCAACLASLPLLDSLESEMPGRVVAVSDDSPTTLAQYAKDHDIKFAVLTDAHGSVVDRLPRHGTPVFLVYDSSRVRSLVIGVPDAAARRQLLSAVRDSAHFR